ncbi:RNA polymerase sigma factor [Vibrio variabilis]|uniref:RNA polymerase sigma factor n=2 Tax=Vibrio TaxID=662 RepID=A0ABR4Y9E8_9VIBR|nr:MULTISPECIES: RNA polymerase sigma factor [Vibrio]KHA60093.1 RNA polymerase sigma factor [Vibrio variabilis]KHD24357.1 RNA polymerase sigma factor [Vibrio caribbeanicus]KHT45353.1 RNA polymerase sigma factor [Vibrio sinaloensis]KHT49019.1 RNA polymerase sigma factor [Vibrio sinaloensis]KIE20430.1 RNA polymerase sigma factor [Vibrio sinaloensis]
MSNVDTQNFSKSDWASCMERVKQQDKQAFALVFKHFSPRLKQFTYRHVGNEQVAMEMVQETLATVWQKSALFNSEKSSLSTWIFTIARNLCFDMLRRQKGRDQHIHSEDIWPNDYCPPDMVEHYSPEADRMKEQVVKFLDTLPEAQRKVVQAVYLEDLPHQQVADMLDIPLGTVKSRLRLAVEKLRISIEADKL